MVEAVTIQKQLPRDYILKLIKSVTDDTVIADLCRQKFGNQVTAERVAELRRGVRV